MPRFWKGANGCRRRDHKPSECRPNHRAERGTFFPVEIKRREYVMGIVRDVYERHGFEPLETPAFENIDTLLGKYGEEGNKLIFKILRRGEHEASGEADLALRYDLTVPLARVVAQYQNELPRFFKRYQIQPVWRADRPASGRFREFYQCDIDAIGTTSRSGGGRAAGGGQRGAGAARLRGFPRSGSNHRELLTGLLTIARRAAARCMARRWSRSTNWTRSAPTACRQELMARGSRRRRRQQPFSSCFARRTSRPAIVGARLAADVRGTDAVRTARRSLVGLAEGTPAGRHLRVDPSLARGLSYYTGAIMEIAVPDLAGSLGGGGRYDNLIGMFLGRDIPACGFSLGLERIIFVMTERNMFPASVAQRRRGRDGHDLEPRDARPSLALASELRARRACAWTCIQRPTSSASSSSTRRAGTCRSSRFSATTSALAAKCRSRICERASSRVSRVRRSRVHSVAVDGAPRFSLNLGARKRDASHNSRAGHPASRRCDSLRYVQYSRSSRLAIRVPRSATSQRITLPGHW